MIVGIGTDIVGMERVRGVVERLGDAFARRVLAEPEYARYDSYARARQVEFLAGRFAAKEAMAKAVGCGLGRLGMQHVSIDVGPTGLVVEWTTRATEPPWPMDSRWHVSISHDTHSAIAFALLESDAERRDSSETHGASKEEQR